MNNENETFKDIIGFEGLYQISNQGRVKNIKTGKILKARFDDKGYYRINLYNNNKVKIIRVHRLVALHFIKKITNKPNVNHINGIKTDNRVENLEWCNQSENMLHSCYTLGNLIKSVIQMDLEGNVLNIYKSIKEAGLNLNINSSHITSVCNNKRKTAGGYKWKFNV